jgi:uncharacterized RDD family membrane protein YckC
MVTDLHVGAHKGRKMIHAGFWRRFAAYCIDAFPIFLVTGLVFYFFLGFDETVRTYLHGPRDTESRRLFLAERNHIRDLSIILWLIYGVLMDASRFQGTLGKRLMGMCVVDETGCRLSFTRALARNLGKILSALPLFLGFMWIGWSKTKQGWHDKMSHCFIVRTSKDNGAPIY